MKVKYNMVVDFARPTKSNTILISEGDTDSRVMHFNLLFDKQAFDMTDVVSVIVKGITSSGQAIFDSTATIVTDEEGNKLNEIEYVVPADLSNLTGTITVTVSLTSAQGETITSFECYLKVRNALYNEDDVVSEEDMAGFRELLRRTEAALARIEDMVQKDALPCPESIRITVDGVDYEYFGKDPVDITMGFIPYISNEIGEMEETRDDSAAHRAAISEANAKASEEAAALSEQNVETMTEEVVSKMAAIDEKVAQATKSASDAEFYYNNIDQLTPRASVTRDDVTGVTTINISDVTGVTSAEVRDGIDGEPGQDGKDGNSLTATSNKVGKVTTVTITDTNTGEVVNSFTIQDGADGTGGGGDMKRETYDQNDDGIVDAAESISKGTITLTAEQLKAGIEDNIKEPTTEGTDGQVLTTDGNGNRSWKTVKGGQDNYISSVEDTEFNVSEAGKLSLASQISDKLSDIDDKITKPTSATKDQVLTFNGTDWVAEDSQGSGIEEPTELEKAIIGGDEWIQKTYVTGETCIDNNKVYFCKADTNIRPSLDDGSHWDETSLSKLCSNSIKFFDQLTTTNQNGFANITAPINLKIVSAMTNTRQAQISIVVADDGSCYAFRFTTYTGGILANQTVRLIYAYI